MLLNIIYYVLLSLSLSTSLSLSLFIYIYIHIHTHICRFRLPRFLRSGVRGLSSQHTYMHTCNHTCNLTRTPRSQSLHVILLTPLSLSFLGFVISVVFSVILLCYCCFVYVTPLASLGYIYIYIYMYTCMYIICIYIYIYMYKRPGPEEPGPRTAAAPRGRAGPAIKGVCYICIYIYIYIYTHTRISIIIIIIIIIPLFVIICVIISNSIITRQLPDGNCRPSLRHPTIPRGYAQSPY